MLTFRIEFEGMDQVLAVLTSWRATVADLAQVMPEISEVLAGEAEDRIMSSGAHDGARYAPLTRRYAARKQKRWGSAEPILFASGRLLSSLANPDHAERVLTVTRKSADWGTRVPYAGYHHTGTKYAPARPPLRVTEKTAALVEAAYLLRLERLRDEALAAGAAA